MPLLDEPLLAWPEPREIALSRNTVAECLQAISHAAIAVGMAKDLAYSEKWTTEMVRLRLAVGVAIERLYSRIETLEERKGCCS